MKKVLVLLLACLASTVMFAQEHVSHWGQPVTVDLTQNQTLKITSVFAIDEVEIYNGEGMHDAGGANIEIAAFSQDGVLRCAKFPTWRANSNQWIYGLQIYGNAGFTYTFKVYDHNTDQELNLVEAFENNYVHTGASQSFGKPSAPIVLNFTQAATEGYTLEIDPYTGEKDNYYLIASPVGAIQAGEVEGLMTPSYDFYSFNANGTEEEPDLEWINHKDNAEFELLPGVGYLYANNTGTDLTFPVGSNLIEDEEYTVELVNEGNEDLDFYGWNLVGNPFAVEAYLNVPFYTLGQDGYTKVTDNTIALPAMNGAFVFNGESSVNFSKTAPSKASSLALNLSDNGKVVDRAIVSFVQGQQMPKFQIFKNSKIYIPKDGHDYALVRSEGMGEMPVNFKAESNGTYNLTLTSENVNFAYLHLVDNMTGADQDLLANPSYSFSANTTDYASRFRLVFATGNDEDNFAFFSNGNLIISNDGNATLQVIDVTGRIVKCENINGCASVSINAAPGVYMVRLVNGDNVRVQKVVK